jgi:hypothetical protein
MFSPERFLARFYTRGIASSFIHEQRQRAPRFKFVLTDQRFMNDLAGRLRLDLHSVPLSGGVNFSFTKFVLLVETKEHQPVEVYGARRFIRHSHDLTSYVNG